MVTRAHRERENDNGKKLKIRVHNQTLNLILTDVPLKLRGCDCGRKNPKQFPSFFNVKCVIYTSWKSSRWILDFGLESGVRM